MYFHWQFPDVYWLGNFLKLVANQVTEMSTIGRNCKPVVLHLLISFYKGGVWYIRCAN